jgi:hypothetical protein
LTRFHFGDRKFVVIPAEMFEEISRTVGELWELLGDGQSAEESDSAALLPRSLARTLRVALGTPAAFARYRGPEMEDDERFFYEHSLDPSDELARRDVARQLACAEEHARNEHWTYAWIELAWPNRRLELKDAESIVLADTVQSGPEPDADLNRMYRAHLALALVQASSQKPIAVCCVVSEAVPTDLGQAPGRDTDQSAPERRIHRRAS